MGMSQLHGYIVNHRVRAAEPGGVVLGVGPVYWLREVYFMLYLRPFCAVSSTSSCISRLEMVLL